MANLEAGAGFLREGGSDPAPMSTTKDLKIAVQYSLSSSAFLFKLKTKSRTDCGADISWVRS